MGYVRLPHFHKEELVHIRSDGTYGKLMQTLAKTHRERSDLLKLIEDRVGRRATLNLADSTAD